MFNGNFCILSPSDMETQFVAKGRVTTPILFYMVGFKKVMRGRKKKTFAGKKYWLVLNFVP